jgi:hypothetical protein
VDFCGEICRDITIQSAKRIIVPDPMQTAQINAALLRQGVAASRNKLPRSQRRGAAS